MKEYVLNKETQKIQLSFTKEEYKKLSLEEQKKLKSAYLFSGKHKSWVSRSKNNHFRAINIAQNLGFVEGGCVGERLTYQQELENQKTKKINKIEKYKNYSNNAQKRADDYQKEFNSYRGDISFFTQPVIIGHRGSEKFDKYRQKVISRYEKGFEEYRKSEYFLNKIDNLKNSINNSKLENKSYLYNSIEKCNKEIKLLEKVIQRLEMRLEKNQINSIKVNQELTLKYEELEYQVDKLAFFQNKVDEVGGFTKKEFIKIGYLVKVPDYDNFFKVLKINKKTFEIKFNEYNLKFPIAIITDIKIPNGWKEEEKKEISNPFNPDDILVMHNASGSRIIYAYQILKTSSKTVTIKKIRLDDNKKPILNDFSGDNAIRKTVKCNAVGKFVVIMDGWCLYKYI